MVPGATPLREKRRTLVSLYTGSARVAGISESCTRVGASLTTVPSGRTTRIQLTVSR